MHKKLISSLLSATLILSTSPVFALQIDKPKQFKVDGYVNKQGIKYVKVTDVVKALGLNVKWNPEQKTVTISDKNGNVATGVPDIINGSSYLPEGFFNYQNKYKAKFDWDSKNKTMTVNSNNTIDGYNNNNNITTTITNSNVGNTNSFNQNSFNTITTINNAFYNKGNQGTLVNIVGVENKYDEKEQKQKTETISGTIDVHQKQIVTIQVKGGKYVGEAVNEIPHGEGKVYDNNGHLIFEGTFDMGEYKKGKLYDKETNTLRYEGEFKNNKPNGQGKVYFNGELRYEGNFKDSKMDGYGTFYYPGQGEKGKLEGYFKDNKYIGK